MFKQTHLQKAFHSKSWRFKRNIAVTWTVIVRILIWRLTRILLIFALWGRVRNFMVSEALSQGQTSAEAKVEAEEAVNSLVFDGTASWFGRGDIIRSRDPQDPEQLHHEGTRHFRFITDPAKEAQMTEAERDKVGMDEEAIIQLEKEFVGPDIFRSFPTHFASCFSGAIT